jgi:hypothetical protein
MEKSHVGMYNCYFCGEEVGILLDKRLRNSLPQNVGPINAEPCDKCAGYMKQGIIVMSIADDTTAEDMEGREVKNRFGRPKGKLPPNPYRTGGWAVVKQEAVERMLEDNEAYLKFAVTKRFLFITSSAWNALGFEPKVKVMNKGDK